MEIMYKKPSTQTVPNTVDKYLSSSYQELTKIINNIDALLLVSNGLAASLKFLGASETIPTLRLDGNPLEDGDYYLDTVNNALEYYDLFEDVWITVDTGAAVSSAAAAAISEINAAISEANASISEEAASISEVNAKLSETNAKLSEEAAFSSEGVAANAATSAVNSKDTAVAAANEATSSKDTAVASALDATNKANASNDSAIASNISAVAAAASALNAKASEEAALVSENNASASEANALSSEGTATTSATTAITNKDIAVAAANESTTSKDIAVTASVDANASADAANTSAIAANASAVAAAASETNVLAAEVSINSTFDDFDDRFLGTFSVPPSLDNDGNPISIGAVYYDSVTKETRFWNGVSWDAPSTSAATSATAANNSAVAAASSASAASTSESNAATSESNASTSASNAFTSETNAGLSETNASDSETAAGLSEVSANNSAISASNSAGTAAADATRAEVAADSVEALKNVITKAEFFALAEQNKFASGFKNWGKHYVALAPTWAINGLWGTSSYENNFLLGRANGQGVSSTDAPVLNISGQHIKLSSVNSAGLQSILPLPPAPDGTKTYDSANGAVVQHVDSATAFEGSVVNGDFRNGTTGWVMSANSNVTNGILNFTVDNEQVETATPVLEANKVQLVKVVVTELTGTAQILYYAGGVFQTTILKVGVNTFSTLSNTDSSPLLIKLVSGGSSLSVSSVSAMPATKSVITSRQDFMFLESFHEKISDKDVVYPLGNVQYGGTTYEGIALAVNGIAQGYSAFGEWDTTTTGNCAVWSSLTDAQKTTFAQNHENNIYSDNGELIQVRYRVRVIEGLGDNWKYVTPLNGAKNDGANATFLSYAAGGAFVLAQGQGVVPKSSGTLTDGVFNSAAIYGNTYGSWSARGSSWSLLDPNIAHNGLCFAIPVALVQRRNQGAYHPTYNPEGTAYATDGIDLNNRAFWYNSASAIANTQDAFANASTNPNANGSLTTTTASGGSLPRGDGKYYDAIYASDVADLRMSSEKKAANEISEIYSRKIMDDEVRGFEGVPFTRIERQDLPTTEAELIQVDMGSTLGLNLGDTVYSFHATHGWTKCKVIQLQTAFRVTLEALDKSVFGRTQGSNMLVLETTGVSLHQQANPTRTDIIGSPANIAATFPDGVEAQWIPTISSDTVSFKLSKKSLEATLTQEYTNDSGVTWSVVATVVNEVANTVESHTNFVRLLHYETQANFTEADALGVALHKSTSVMATNNHNDAILVSSLTGVVPTSTDNNEELSITKSVNGVISHTAESMVANVLFTTQIESENGVAKFAFNIDDSGVIDSTNAQSFNTQYFINEE